MSKRSTAYAGIDTGKAYLDTALHKHGEEPMKLVRRASDPERARVCRDHPKLSDSVNSCLLEPESS